MLFLVSYDIRDDKRLRRVAKVMEDFGKRVQFSVFECDIDRLATFIEMKKLLNKTIDTKCDSVRIYDISIVTKKVEIMGQGKLTMYDDVIVI